MSKLNLNLDNPKKGIEHLVLLSRLFLTEGMFLVVCKHRTLNTKQSEELRSFFEDEGFRVYKLKKVYTNMFFLEKQTLYNYVNWSNILTGSILVLRGDIITANSLSKVFDLSLFYEKQRWLVPYLFYYNKRFYSIPYIKDIMQKSKKLKKDFLYLGFYRLVRILLILLLMLVRFYYIKIFTRAYVKSISQKETYKEKS